MSAPRKGSHLAIVTGLSLALSVGLASRPHVAHAARPTVAPEETAAARLEQKALKAAVAGDQAKAITALRQALRTCEPAAACSAKTKARLHVTLGTVHGVGEGDFDAAKKEFIVALSLDPQARLRTLASRQLSTVFEEARVAAAPSAPTPPPAKGPETAPQSPASVAELFHPAETAPPPPPGPTSAPPPPDPTTVPRFNWFSVRAMVDFNYLSDANVCSPGAPSNYFCTDEGGARYAGRPQPNDSDVSSGFATGTGRLLLGYERLLVAGLTAGAAAGFAFPFSSAPAGRSGMLPIHLEARASYTFGAAPYVDNGDRINPFVFVSFGGAQFDSHVVIRVNEVPCASKVSPACKRDLDVNRRLGNVFTSFGGGVRVRLQGRHALRAGVRATVVLGEAGGLVLSPALAYELGI